MEKKKFILLLSLLSAISFAQLSENGLPLNKLRKLESSSNETILLGYDHYNFTYDSSTKQSNCNFTVHFLLKNWNYTIDDFKDETIIKFNNITLKAIINYQGDDEGKEAEFNCSKKEIEPIYSKYDSDEYYPYYHYYRARFLCDYNLTGRGIPKKINITTNFTNDIYLNETQVSFVSSSAEALEKDLVSLKYETEKFKILENANFTSQSPNSFKIKGELDDRYRYDSENIYLITTVNGSPKKILCSGKRAKDNSDDKDYYFLQSKGSNNLAGANLSYALLNYTTGDNEKKMAIISFAENSKNANGTILPPKVEYKKKSGGLSTGGICAIVIPSVLVLLGVGALVFFLSRRAVPSPPIKAIGNNTMGVVASSEAVVHQ